MAKEVGLRRDLELRRLLLGYDDSQATRTHEENQGDKCSFHRSLGAGDLLLLTSFLVFYQRRNSPGRTGPAQEQVPKEGETQMALPPKCRSAIEVPVLPRME